MLILAIFTNFFLANEFFFSAKNLEKEHISNLEQENLEMCESFLLRSNVNFIPMLSPFLNCKLIVKSMTLIIPFQFILSLMSN
jgi:hypothetical protein